MNSFTMVGKITKLPTIYNERGWKSATVMIDVERPFANNKGEFESDLIEVTVYRGAAETLAACARMDGWVCVKGRIQSRAAQKEGKTWLNYGLIAEKIEFLT